MNRILLFISFLCFTTTIAIAQPQEKQDFFLNVLANPTFCLEDFRDVGLNSSNTSMQPESEYLNAKNQKFHSLMIQALGKDDYNTRKATYKKVVASWRIFIEIQNAGGTCRYSKSNNIWDNRAKNTSAELKQKLSIIPLKY